MIPMLFEADAKVTGNQATFTGHGLGDLKDIVSCVVEYGPSDGTYEDELAFEYPVTGPMFNEIQTDRIVVADVGGGRPLQGYRIYSIRKTMKGQIEVSCQHISYDLSDIPVKGFKATTVDYAISNLKKNVLINYSPYTITLASNASEFDTLTEKEQFDKEEPGSMREFLMDGDESIQGKFGGDIVVNNFKTFLYRRAGENRGITIRYGIDLVDIDQETNLSEMVTGVVGYFRNGGDKNTVTYARDIATNTREYIPESCKNLAHQRIKAVDLTNYFDKDTATEQEIYNKSKEYANKEELGEPEISLTLSYAQLGQDVRLYDQINVEFPKLGIEKSAKVTKITYDVLKERITEVEVGKVKKSALFSLDDASRLKRGLLPVDRIKQQSIGSSCLSSGAGTSRVIGDGAVGINKLDKDVTQKFTSLEAGYAKIGELDANIAALKQLTFDQGSGGYLQVKNLRIFSNLIVNGAAIPTTFVDIVSRDGYTYRVIGSRRY